MCVRVSAEVDNLFFFVEKNAGERLKLKVLKVGDGVAGIIWYYFQCLCVQMR